MQINTWLSCDSSQLPAPVVRSPRAVEEHLYLEDVQTDEDKLNDSLLSSESTFLPVKPDLPADPARSESEDETETFEPDSLAPERQTRPKKPPTENHPLSEKEREKEIVVGEAKSTEGYHNSASTAAVNPSGVSHLLQDTSSDCGTMEVRLTPKREDVVMCADGPSSSEAHRAAVSIQSWWRGLSTRHGHPLAKEVRSEIRLRRMQDHILFLSGELER